MFKESIVVKSLECWWYIVVVFILYFVIKDKIFGYKLLSMYFFKNFNVYNKV